MLTFVPLTAVVEATTGAPAAITPSAKADELAVPETPQTNEADNCVVPCVLGEACVLSNKLKVVVPFLLLQEIFLRVIAYCFLNIASIVVVEFIRLIDSVPLIALVEVEITPLPFTFNNPLVIPLKVNPAKVGEAPVCIFCGRENTNPTVLEAVTVN